MTATLHTDGGARGNPGPAGIGYVLTLPDRTIGEGEYIGETTNNQAEYQAIIAVLVRAQQEGITDLECFLDSELVVRQVNGIYKVKNAELKPLVKKVQELKGQFRSITFTHIPREKNAAADKLVNKAIDSHEK